MKKLLFLFFLSLSVASLSAQELTPPYFARCKEILKVIRHRDSLSQYYIWCPAASVSDLGQPVALLKDGPLKLYPFSPPGYEPKDSVQLSGADVSYLKQNLSEQHDSLWRNQLAIGTGLLSGKPWLKPTEDRYYIISPPLFFHNDSLCIVYIVKESPDSRHSEFALYHREHSGWQRFASWCHRISCGG